MRWLGGVLIGLVFARAAGTAQKQVEQVRLCDVLKNAEQFDGKEVTFRATWRYGFEWTYLYCVECKNAGHVWFEVSDNLDDASRRVLNSKPKDAGIVNVTLTGVFRTGSYGHQSGYPHELIVRKARDLVVLSKGMKDPKKEAEIEAKYGCGGTNPK